MLLAACYLNLPHGTPLPPPSPTMSDPIRFRLAWPLNIPSPQPDPPASQTPPSIFRRSSFLVSTRAVATHHTPRGTGNLRERDTWRMALDTCRSMFLLVEALLSSIFLFFCEISWKFFCEIFVPHSATATSSNLPFSFSCWLISPITDHRLPFSTAGYWLSPTKRDLGLRTQLCCEPLVQ